jgi:predicted kinase
MTLLHSDMNSDRHIGTPDTSLIVLRGNAAVGKSTTARELRERLGKRVGWIEHDAVRHSVPEAWETADSPMLVELLAQQVRYILDHGGSVILEGRLRAWRYAGMLRMLGDEHRGQSLYYYFDTSFEETARRHAIRPQATQFGADVLRTWWRERDWLPFVERVIPEEWTLDETVERILLDVQAKVSCEPSRA